MPPGIKPPPITFFILFTRYDRIADKAGNVKNESKKKRKREPSFITAEKDVDEEKEKTKKVQKNAKKRLTSSDGSCIIQLVLEIS